MRKLMRAERTTKRDRLQLYASTAASQCLAVIVILWRAQVHGIHRAQLGLAAPNIRPVILACVVLVSLSLTNQLLSLRGLVSRPAEKQASMVQLAMRVFPHDSFERVVFLILVAAIAVCEEIVYRGFA